MSKVFFEDNSMRFMERSLDLAVERQSLISGNLANVDTPGYKTVDLNFEQELKQAGSGEPPAVLHVTNAHHLQGINDGKGGPGAVLEVDGLPVRNDLNNVNVDREMGELSMNALRFSMVAQLLTGKFRTLKSAISEGR